MAFTRDHALDQALDIAGSTTPNDSLIKANEPLGLGSETGQSGSLLSIDSISGSSLTVSGLTGMADVSSGRYLTISGSANAGNNGTFLITSYISATSAVYENAAGVFPDANSGSISWIERNPYSLQDDINYIRTDRSDIKGVGYADSIPTYTRPDDTLTDVPANLANIAGKTTDAKAFVLNRKYSNVAVSSGDDYIVLSGAGEFPHADSVDRTGVPISDGADAGNYEAYFVDVLDGYDERLYVLGGTYDGYLIFGWTRAGGSVDGDSVEVEFRATPVGNINDSVAYEWEFGQVETINLYYGYRERLDEIDETALRTVKGNGILTGITDDAHASLRQLIHLANGGPYEGFASGAYREVLPAANPFPTQVIWWEDSGKTQKIVEKNVVRNSNKTPATVQWKAYAVNGITVVATVTDTITYSGIFELSRTRVIT